MISWCREYWSRCILRVYHDRRQLPVYAKLSNQLHVAISMLVLHLERLCVQCLLLHLLLCCCVSVRLAVLPVRIMTVPTLLPHLEIFSCNVICCICYSQLQIGWHRILRLFLQTSNLVPGVPGLGFIIYYLVLIVYPMGRLLVR